MNGSTFRWKEFECDDKARSVKNIVCSSLRGPQTEAISRASDDKYIQLTVNPEHYGDDIEGFAEDWLAVNILSKYPELALDVDREAVAIKGFLEAEQACLEANLRVLYPSPVKGVEAVIHTARRKITRLLGTFDWDAAATHMGFSNGASTRLTKREAMAPNKFSCNKGALHVTRACLPLAVAAVKQSPLWSELLTAQRGADPLGWFHIVEGNSLTTVPKNAKTDRVIAKEPDMNMFVQRGIGALIRRKLKRVGVDLNNQMKNQQLALEGSVHDVLATVDLKAASDTISCELVSLLLPDDWTNAIFRTRSPIGILPNGDRIHYQKVSSMGNGFTFELESLIFWALTAACVEHSNVTDRRIAVYGDDIIVDRAACDLLRDVMQFCGFTVNDEKSFYSGPFRESCGKHYYRGCDVTPFYVRKPLTNVSRLFWAVNAFRRWSSRVYGFSPKYHFDAWKKLALLIPKRFRGLSVPDGIGDGGVLRSFDDARPLFTRRRSGKLRIPVVGNPFISRHMAGHLLYLDALCRLPEAGRSQSVLELAKHSQRSKISLPGNGQKVSESASTKVRQVDPDRFTIRRIDLVVWDDPPMWVDIRDDRRPYTLLAAV